MTSGIACFLARHTKTIWNGCVPRAKKKSDNAHKIYENLYWYWIVVIVSLEELKEVLMKRARYGNFLQFILPTGTLWTYGIMVDESFAEIRIRSLINSRGHLKNNKFVVTRLITNWTIFCSHGILVLLESEISTYNDHHQKSYGNGKCSWRLESALDKYRNKSK